MSNLEVPEQFVEPLRALASLSDAGMERILALVGADAPAEGERDFAQSILEVLESDRNEGKAVSAAGALDEIELARSVISLALTIELQGFDSMETALTVASDQRLGLEEEEIERFATALGGWVSGRGVRALAMVAYTGGLSEKLVHASKAYVDFRPAVATGVDSPLAFSALLKLNLEVHTGGEIREFEFGLTRGDAKQLADGLNGALNAREQTDRALTEAGFIVLEPWK